jgi:phenylalanyl-tRNA synthetase beta chain
LLLQIAGGQAGPVTVTESPERLPQTPRISLRADRVNSLLGCAIDEQTVLEILRSLQMQVDHDQEQRRFIVTPPSARLDLQLEVDLIEEVARLYGYDQLPANEPAGKLRLPPMPEAVISMRRLQSMCADLGYREVMNFTFIRQSLLQICYPERDSVALSNPISSDLSHMRTGLIPGLLLCLQHNLNNKRGRYRQSVRLFESGTVFNADDDHPEQQHLALLAAGNASPEQWARPSRHLDFYDFKGDIEQLLGLNAHEFTYAPCANHPCLHPGQAAKLYKTVSNQMIFAGVIGRLHPHLCQQLELPKHCYVAELKASVVTETELTKAANVSKYPTIRRDLALIVPEDLPAFELLSGIRRLGDELLKDVYVFDVYHGSGIESEHKSLAIGLILQDSYRTLTDDRADDLIAGILRGLEQEYQVRLRQA